jgi:hypothetical protein
MCSSDRVSSYHQKHVFFIQTVVNHQNSTFFKILLNHTRQILFDVLQIFYICQLKVLFTTFGMARFTHWPPGKEGGQAIEFLQT